MANTGIEKGCSPTPLRTVSTIRREIQALEQEYLNLPSIMVASIVGYDYIDRINAKKSIINFLTTRIRRRKFYNWLRKKTGCK